MTEMIMCEVCKVKPKVRVKWAQYTCETCEPVRFPLPGIVGTTHLKGYGDVSNKRLSEMERRVILPDARNDGEGDYYVGRKMESGKVSENHIPSY